MIVHINYVCAVRFHKVSFLSSKTAEYNQTQHSNGIEYSNGIELAFLCCSGRMCLINTTLTGKCSRCTWSLQTWPDSPSLGLCTLSPSRYMLVSSFYVVLGLKFKSFPLLSSQPTCFLENNKIYNKSIIYGLEY